MLRKAFLGRNISHLFPIVGRQRHSDESDLQAHLGFEPEIAFESIRLGLVQDLLHLHCFGGHSSVLVDFPTAFGMVIG